LMEPVGHLEAELRDVEDAHPLRVLPGRAVWAL
jgi:hypothetical protein